MASIFPNYRLIWSAVSMRRPSKVANFVPIWLVCVPPEWASFLQMWSNFCRCDRLGSLSDCRRNSTNCIHRKWAKRAASVWSVLLSQVERMPRCPRQWHVRTFRWQVVGLVLGFSLVSVALWLNAAAAMMYSAIPWWNRNFRHCLSANRWNCYGNFVSPVNPEYVQRSDSPPPTAVELYAQKSDALAGSVVWPIQMINKLWLAERKLNRNFVHKKHSAVAIWEIWGDFFLCVWIRKGIGKCLYRIYRVCASAFFLYYLVWEINHWDS